MAKDQSDGRKRNGALPLGLPGAVSKASVKRTGERERQSAGPDGPDAGVVGETFKHPPGHADGDVAKAARPKVKPARTTY